MNILFQGDINIEFGQFYISTNTDEAAENFDVALCFSDQNNGLVGAQQLDQLYFNAAVHCGDISIRVEMHDNYPAVDQSYEDIVEVSFTRASEPLHLSQWAWEVTHKLGIPLGQYRLRYLIDGGDLDYEETDDQVALEESLNHPIPGQRYLIQIWPGEYKGDVVVKQTSEAAKNMNETWPMQREKDIANLDNFIAGLDDTEKL